MINVSNGFQTNVDAGRMRVLLHMGGALIEDGDLAGAGLKVSESLGPGDSYTVGNAPAGTISFALMNQDGRFSSMSFGECRAVGYATDGARTTIGAVSADVGGLAYSPYKGTNYIRTRARRIETDDGTLLYQTLPTYTVRLMMVEGNMVYILFGDSASTVSRFFIGNGTWGSTEGLSWSRASATYDHMGSTCVIRLDQSYANENIRQMMIRGAEGGACGLSLSDSAVKDFYISGGNAQRVDWEGCPIGVFDIEKPAQTGGNTIDCDGYGIMSRFDGLEMDDYTTLFPISNRDLLTRVCADAGIGKSFTPVQNITLTSNYWAGFTARDFVKECAGVDAANALVDRTGQLIFRKPAATAASFSESNYSNITIAEFTVPAITGVTIKNSDADVGASAGTADEVMTVLENSCAGQLDATAKSALAAYILGEVDNIAAYKPIDADMWVGWQLEAGDTVTIVRNSVSYSIPIFGVEFTITSGCRASVSVTGKEHRNDMMESNREAYVFNRQRLEIKKDMNGLLVAVFDEHGQSRIEQQAQLISACVTKTGGSASSFGWELTATSWSLKSNGAEVLKVDSSGMKLNGELNCQKLTVGGTDYSVNNLQQIFYGGQDCYNRGNDYNAAWVYAAQQDNDSSYYNATNSSSIWSTSYRPQTLRTAGLYAGSLWLYCTCGQVTGWFQMLPVYNSSMGYWVAAFDTQ